MRVYISVVFLSVFLSGCPKDQSDISCEKVMRCEEDTEMFCDKPDAGCGEDCHYFVIEHCFESCK